MSGKRVFGTTPFALLLALIGMFFGILFGGMIDVYLALAAGTLLFWTPILAEWYIRGKFDGVFG